MHQPKRSRATGGSQGAGGNDALAASGVRFSYSKSHGLKLAGASQPAAAGSSCLIPAARQIEIVHRFSDIGAQNWTVVLRDGARKKTVAAYASRREAIEQLGGLSQKFYAKVVGRGSAVAP